MTRAKDISKILTDADFSGTLDVTGDLTVDTNTLKVDSSNNYVGIGIASPSATLHLDASGGAFMKLERTGQGHLFLSTDGTNGSIRTSSASGALKFQTNGNNERMRITNSGNVGIGTSSPISMLTISAGVQGVSGGSDAAVRLINNFDNPINEWVIEPQRQGVSNTGLSIRDVTDSRTDMTFDGAGNVGIGTSSPSTPLHMQAGGQNAHVRVQASDNGYAARLQLYANNVSGASYNAIQSYVNGDGTAQWEISGPKASAEDQMLFHTGGSERMRIDSSGNVGIGTTNPTRKLHVNGNIQIAQDDAFYFDTTAIPSYINRSNAGFNIRPSNGLPVRFNTLNGNEAMRVNSDGNVGIGITSPASLLHVKSSTVDARLQLTNSASADDTTGSGASFQLFNDDLYINAVENSGNIIFRTDGGGGFVERMRIVSSGNVLVGTTNQSPAEGTTVGVRIGGNGTSQFSSSGDAGVQINRTSDDGDLMRFYRDGSTKGRIYINGSGSEQMIGIGAGQVFLRFQNSDDTMRPSNNTGANADNVFDFGASNARFDDIFATNGTIQTSDRNEKQDIEELSEAEQRVAVVAKGLMRKFRWKDKVAKKGDNARTHFGIIAQDLQDAFTAEGLDAGDYAMFTSNTWTNDDGNEQTRLGVRYNQLLAFIISAI